MAVPFYVKATGYKARTAPGFRPKLQSETCVSSPLMHELEAPVLGSFACARCRSATGAFVTRASARPQDKQGHPEAGPGGLRHKKAAGPLQPDGTPQSPQGHAHQRRGHPPQAAPLHQVRRPSAPATHTGTGRKLHDCPQPAPSHTAYAVTRLFCLEDSGACLPAVNVVSALADFKYVSYTLSRPDLCHCFVCLAGAAALYQSWSRVGNGCLVLA